MSATLTEEIRKKYAAGTLDFNPMLMLEVSYMLGKTFARQFQPREKESSWDVVSSWNCPRKKAFLKHLPPGGKPKPLPFHTIGKFIEGDIHEIMWMGLAKAAGLPIKHCLSDQLILPTCLGRGMSDGFYNEEEVLEVKYFTFEFLYKKFARTPAGLISNIDDEFGYATQANTYAHEAVKLGLIKPPGKIRMIGISVGFQVTEIVFDLDPALYERRAEEFKAVDASTSPFDLPTLPQEEDDLEGRIELRKACRYDTAFAWKCWEHEGFNVTTRKVYGEDKPYFIERVKYE